MYLYADDAKVYKIISSSEDQEMLQRVINRLKEWCDKWLVSVNASKCNQVSYTAKHKLILIIISVIITPNHFIESVDHIKDLGVTFDSHLSFYDHIGLQEKINKAYSMIGLIKRNFIHMDKNTFCLL